MGRTASRTTDGSPQKPGDRISEARRLAGEEDFTGAVRQLGLALDADPESSEVRGLLVRIKESLGRSRALRVAELLKEAKSRFEQGDMEGARALATQVFEIDGDNQEALDLLVDSQEATHLEEWTHGMGGDGAGAEGGEDTLLLEKVERLLERSTRAKRIAAAVARSSDRIRAHDLSGARRALEEVEESYPDSEELEAARRELRAREQELRDEKARHLASFSPTGSSASTRRPGPRSSSTARKRDKHRYGSPCGPGPTWSFSGTRSMVRRAIR